MCGLRVWKLKVSMLDRRYFFGKTDDHHTDSAEPSRITHGMADYHHLLYFWTVAREGDDCKAAKYCCLPATISEQVFVNWKDR